MRHRVLVNGQRSWRKSLPVMLAAMSAVVLMPILYGLARNVSLGDGQRTDAQAAAAQLDRQQSARQLRDLQAQNAQLLQDAADLSRGREIDRQALGGVQKSLAAEQQEAAALREQLAFYRGVMSPQALRSGLHVNELRVSRGAAAQTYRYDLVLVQSARQQRRATGRVELRFIGLENSVQRSLTLSEIAADGPDGLLFSFRHFQEFGGEFHLPAGFLPRRVVVTLMPDGGDTPQVEEEFAWAQIQERSPAEKP